MPSATEALNKLRDKASKVKKQKNGDAQTRIIVGTATCGISAGANAVLETLQDEIKAKGLNNVAISETGCSGRCDLEPLVQVIRNGESPVLYCHVDEEKARRILQQHVINGEIIPDWVIE